MWRYEQRILRKYEIVILLVVAIGFLLSATDYFAINWHVWYYDPRHTLHIRIGAEVETYLFGATAFLVVSSATIIAASLTDQRQGKPKVRRRSGKKARRI